MTGHRPQSPWTALVVQQFTPGTAGPEKEAATEDFFTWIIWPLVLVPMAIVIVLAAMKRKRSQVLPHTTDLSWEDDVTGSPIPVVVHAYSSWSVGDRVIEKQVEALRRETQGRLTVYWLDIEKNPNVIDRFPTLEARSVALFVHGRLLWQGLGVHGKTELLDEIEETLAREGHVALEPPPAPGP
jgi:hypothetical protein